MTVIKTLSSKGQVQLPKKWCDQVGVGPGAKLALQVRRGVLIITPLRRGIVEETAGSLRRYVDPDKRDRGHAASTEATKGGQH